MFAVKIIKKFSLSYLKSLLFKMYIVMLAVTLDVEFHRTDRDIQRGQQKRKVISHLFLYSLALYLSLFFCLLICLILLEELILYPLKGLNSVVSVACSFRFGKYGLNLASDV